MNISHHHGAADMGLPDVFAAAHGHVTSSVPLQAKCNNDLAAGGKWRKPVFASRRFDMVQRILAPHATTRVAVYPETGSRWLFHIATVFAKIGPQVRRLISPKWILIAAYLSENRSVRCRHEDQPLEFLLRRFVPGSARMSVKYTLEGPIPVLSLSVQLCRAASARRFSSSFILRAARQKARGKAHFRRSVKFSPSGKGA